MLDNISTIFVQVKEVSSLIDESTSKIAENNKDLTDFAVGQKDNLLVAYKTMVDIAKAVTENAEYAVKVADFSKSSSDLATKGGTSVTSVSDVMSEISKSSTKIESILSVINDIAFRTNILSLNAAVEAARAGEHGRGFAVVAGEVRSLAQRSSDAAKEIEGLIKESVSKTKEGMKSVEFAGGAMDEILSSVNQIVTMIDQISGSSSDQALKISELNEMITEMTKVSQQSVEVVETATEEVIGLENQSNGLVLAVNSYKLVA